MSIHNLFLIDYIYTHSNCIYTYTFTSICIDISPRQQDAKQWSKLLWPSLAASRSAREATKGHPALSLHPLPETSPAEGLEHKFQRELPYSQRCDLGQGTALLKQGLSFLISKMGITLPSC